MFALFSGNAAGSAVSKLLGALDVRINPDYLSEELLKHPDYPSLLAVSDVLTAQHIENVAFRLDYEKLADVPFPFIAHTYPNDGELLVVSGMADDKVFVSGKKWGSNKVSPIDDSRVAL